ncbi:hypothetical protein AVEN_87076-1, partial [Araneus ventricosus]
MRCELQTEWTTSGTDVDHSVDLNVNQMSNSDKIAYLDRSLYNNCKMGFKLLDSLIPRSQLVPKR